MHQSSSKPRVGESGRIKGSKVDSCKGSYEGTSQNATRFFCLGRLPGLFKQLSRELMENEAELPEEIVENDASDPKGVCRLDIGDSDREGGRRFVASSSLARSDAAR